MTTPSGIDPPSQLRSDIIQEYLELHHRMPSRKEIARELYEMDDSEIYGVEYEDEQEEEGEEEGEEDA